MSRNRVIYQSETVFVGPSPATGLHYIDAYQLSGTASGQGFYVGGPYDGQPFNGNPLITGSGQLVNVAASNELKEITRVQTASHSFTINRQDINQFGQLGAIAREIVETPTVSFDMSYYLTDGGNEDFLGLNIGGQVSALSGILNKSTDEKNIFVLTVGEGNDSVNNSDTSQYEVLSIGNAFMSDYSIEASVGGIPTATWSFEALNIQYELGSSGEIPAIIPQNGQKVTGEYYFIPTPSGSYANQISALRHGDIELQLETPFGAKVSGEGSAHIQSFNLSVPITREPLERIGSKFAFSREITFPVTLTLTVNANIADIEAGDLSSILCDDQDYNLAIIMREPNCDAGVVAPVAMRYDIKGAKFDSESVSSSIGANKTVDITFSAQIAGPQDLQRGLFISGAYSG